MGYQKRSRGAKAKVAEPAAAILKPVKAPDAASKRQQQLSKMEREMYRGTSRALHVQRQVIQPVLRAAELHTQEVQRVEGQRATLQRQASDLSAGLPENAAVTALQRQAERTAPVVTPSRPGTPADWVTVMRAHAQTVQAQQDAGPGLDARQQLQHTSLQRQVTQSLVQSFRQDRQSPEARHAQYAEHLLSLQRHALSAPVARVFLGMMPQGEWPSLQRALDTALQREQEQQTQDEQALSLQAIQRQLAELDAEATQPVLQRIQARRGGGNALPEAIQRHLEQGLNADLSRVRVHDDAEADRLSKSVNAVAFTTGQDIFFQAGRFQPNTQSGLELLAHEATHTKQQAEGRVGAGVDPDAGLEAEAQAMGARLSRNIPAVSGAIHTGKALGLRPVATPSLQRQAAAPTAKVSPWRQSGKLRGNPPVRDEFDVPNKNIIEDEAEYNTLRDGAKALLKGQRARSQAMISKDNKSVLDHRFWFARVYSYVTQNEIMFAENRTFDYPSYVMQCVLYFDKLYAGNLRAAQTQAEPHWKAAFKTAAAMKHGDGMPTDAPGIVYALVASMLAHIRFDLPRAEAWVAQSYARRYGAKPSDFKPDFFRMSGVFDNASRDMFTDIRKFLGSGTLGRAVVDLMINQNLSGSAMRHLLGADMSQERLETWRRTEALAGQGLAPSNPYTLTGGSLKGDATQPGAAGVAALSRVNPPALRPSMEGINPTTTDRYLKGVKGVLSWTLGATSEEVILVELTRYKDPVKAAKPSVEERASLLLGLIRAPGGKALGEKQGRGDELILQVLRVSQRRGDLNLLVNMVDAATLLSTLNASPRLQGERLLVGSGYYSALEPANAANQILKWLEAGRSPENERHAARIYNSLSEEKRRSVATMLSHFGIRKDSFLRSR